MSYLVTPGGDEMRRLKQVMTASVLKSYPNKQS